MKGSTSADGWMRTSPLIFCFFLAAAQSLGKAARDTFGSSKVGNIWKGWTEDNEDIPWFSLPQMFALELLHGSYMVLLNYLSTC